MTKAQILIVEDDRIVAKDIQSRLKDLGFAVSSIVSSGAGALRKAKEDTPDLVLMDIVLKGNMNGIEAADQIRTKFNIPVVYLTAYADEELLERAKITEPFGYIIKPFEDNELSTAIGIALYKHKMEKKLRESEEWLSTTLRSIGDAVIATDIKGHVTFMNPVAQSLTGWSEDEAMGKPLKNVFNIINEETRKRVQDPTAKVIREGIVVGLANHTVLIAKDGTEIPVDDSGSPIIDEKRDIIGVVLVFRDVRERKQAEKALRESEERFRELYAEAPVGYHELDREGRIVRVNRTELDMLAYSEEEMLGQPVWEFVVEKEVSRQAFEAKIAGAMPPGRAFERTYRRKDGTTLTVIIEDRLVRNEAGQITGIHSTIQDISERKRLEAQFQQAQRMEAIGTLAGGIAHDFNNILMAIQGNASLMLLEKTSDHPDYERLKNIEQGVKSGADLTKQLLGFAMGGKYEVKPTDLNELIKRSSHMFGRTKKEITIHRKCQEGIWPVEVDQGQIEQVLLNLYVNAWQAMPGGGTLYLVTQNTTLDENSAKPHGVEPGRYVKISLTDTGVGMDEATQQRLFEPFFTTKEMGRGTGLGLASVYGIITVHSIKAEGATFTIYLPASEKELVKEEELPKEVVKGEETVLLVDDEEMVLEVGEEILKELGYTVLIARSGKEAIEIYKAHKDEIAIVVLDMIMPEMGGGETYDRLKEINPDIKVLLSSGYSIDGQAQEILDRGCNGFIQKPFNMKELSQEVRQILDS